MGFEALEGYKPEKMSDGFEVFKANVKCGVDSIRIEDYSGDKEELKGVRFLRYALVVVDDPAYTGRKLWKSYNLSNDDQLKKLANAMFTVGLEFKSEEELEAILVPFSTKLLKVNTWGWKPDDGDERQMHKIKGEATSGEVTTGSAPF